MRSGELACNKQQQQQQQQRQRNEPLQRPSTFMLFAASHFGRLQSPYGIQQPPSACNADGTAVHGMLHHVALSVDV
jgi:hypothetical protein